MPKSLDGLLEVWSVHEPGSWENDSGPKGWWAVSNREGIKAYFGEEADAFRWRMSQICRELNP